MRPILIIASSFAILVSSFAAADDAVSLFNGKDLTGWCFREKTKKDDPNPGKILEKHDGKTEAADAGRYIVKDGAIAVTFPIEADKLTGQLYTVAEFPKNFTLKLEFRASVDADSGVFLRKPQLQCRDYLVAVRRGGRARAGARGPGAARGSAVRADPGDAGQEVAGAGHGRGRRRAARAALRPITSRTSAGATPRASPRASSRWCGPCSRRPPGCRARK